MPSIKVLHIVALLFWCASLLYLPAMLLAGARVRKETPFEVPVPQLLHFLFTHVATPFALLAIASGTLLFIIEQLIGSWLILKLAAVSGMVMCHVMCGFLVERLQRGQRRFVAPISALIIGVAAVLMIAVLILVLSKPFA